VLGRRRDSGEGATTAEYDTIALSEDHKPTDENVRFGSPCSCPSDTFARSVLASSQQAEWCNSAVSMANWPCHVLLVIVLSRHRWMGIPAVARSFSHFPTQPHFDQVCAVPDFRVETVKPGDFLFIACDGIYESDVFTREVSCFEFFCSTQPSRLERGGVHCK